MATLGPKKDGSPNSEFYQSSENIQGFETIRLWLQKNYKKVSYLFFTMVAWLLVKTMTRNMAAKNSVFRILSKIKLISIFILSQYHVVQNL